MLKQVPSPDHVIAVLLDGKLTGEGIQEYRSVLENKLQQYAQISVYVDLTAFSDMNANALIEGAKADMLLLRHLNQVSRCAFVSDKEWPQAIVTIMKLLFPVLDIRVFPSEQNKKAMQWVADISQTPVPIEPAIRFLTTSKDNVLAFEIDGVIKRLEDYLAGHDRVRLLNRIKHFEGFDPSVLMQRGFFSMKLSAMQKVERYAVVGAPSWMGKIINSMSPLFPNIDIRTFSADHEDDAWAWLEAEPAK